MLKKNRALTEDFTKLYLELENEGLFKPSYTHNILRMVELFVIAAIGYTFLQWQNSAAKIIGIILLGLMQGRSGWIQHESGHHSFSGNPKFDRLFHALIFGKFNAHKKLLCEKVQWFGFSEKYKKYLRLNYTFSGD